MAFHQGRAVSFRNLLRITIGLPKGTTQADRIHDDLPESIPGVLFLLKGCSNFPNWDFQVRKILEDIGLQDLIDLDLPHPKKDHRNYANGIDARNACRHG